MRPTLFWKMFLLQLLAAAALVAGVVLVSRALSMRGFAAYIEARDHARVQDVATEVAQSYRQSGDLAAAFDWVTVLHDHWHPKPPPLNMRRPEPPMPPLQLQDASGGYLGGDPDAAPEPRMREPIVLDGRTLGYLAWPHLPAPEQTEFGRRLARHLTAMTPVALVIAALFAALITGLIVKPIRALSVGTAALTRREFAARLPENRRDELGTLAADFNRLAAALEGYDARQKQWLADIAHELRTPLAVLRGEIDALLEGVRNPGPNTVTSLSEEVRRLEALIQDLHLVSLAESGGLRLNVAPTDMGELMRRSATRFGEHFKARGFAVQLAAEPNLVAAIDAQRIEQVLANLLQNVLRHAAAPGPVSLVARADPEGVLVSVADGGPGVPADALPRLFDRLYRADSSRTRTAGGAGLGLSICKSIVEAHGGTIGAAMVGGGLQVRIKLPRV